MTPASSSRAEDIQRRMERVRYEVHEDVEGIVHNARILADWRYYLRKYPWACLASAAAIGYLAVPNRTQLVSPSVEAILELARRNRLVVEAKPKPMPRGGLLAGIATAAAHSLFRSALTALLGKSTTGTHHAKSTAGVPGSTESTYPVG